MALVWHADRHIQNVNHHWCNSHHALILACRREPRCPATLRDTICYETFRLDSEFTTIRKLLDSIHSADNALGHREQQRPRLVLVVLVVMEGV